VLVIDNVASLSLSESAVDRFIFTFAVVALMVSGAKLSAAKTIYFFILGETKKINYTLFVGKDTSSADINKDFKEGIIAGNFGFSASKSGDKVAYISAASGKWGVFAQKTNEKKYYNGASVTTTSTKKPNKWLFFVSLYLCIVF
jgi:hypothetical protein